MNYLRKLSLDRLGYDFVPSAFLPDGADEYYIRDTQQFGEREYRNLTGAEIETLVKNENRCDNWADVWVTDRFDPESVRGCHFFGKIRIGDMEPCFLTYHDLRLPTGLYNSTIVSSDFGNNVAIHNVGYLAHYVLSDEVILFNIDEMNTSNHAKFGNGIVKEGEDEDVRIWLELWNETGARGVMPFDGMLPADAFMWSRFRADRELQNRFEEMTNAAFDRRRGYYGSIGHCTVIKHCRVIKDVACGSHAYIKGANKLKNLTINSDAESTTQIGEGVEMVNGIVGYGCHVFYGVKAVRFILGTNSNLKYGARLINSFLGDNSTVSCCEILHNLIFPAHEQHHNNSFLTSSLVLGQSNIAAGASIGSNHNSRANDGEIIAGRGFWPGLCSSFKHSSRFDSFTLIAKGSYPAELDIKIPFALVSNDEARDRLLIMPGFWFLYNMYAIVRNSWKFQARDKRKHKEQNIEFDYLAPDTIEEMFHGLARLEEWTGKAWRLAHDKDPLEASRDELRHEGRELLEGNSEEVRSLEILGEDMERSRRKVVILKAAEGYAVFREMIHYYAMKNLVRYIEDGLAEGFDEIKGRFSAERVRSWTNVGGQLMKRPDLEDLKQNIVTRVLDSWDAVHDEYNRLWRQYPHDKAAHAYATLLAINEWSPKDLDLERRLEALDRARATQHKIARLTRSARAKDLDNPFRQITFETHEEMEAVVGAIDENNFVRQVDDEARAFDRLVEEIKRKETSAAKNVS